MPEPVIVANVARDVQQKAADPSVKKLAEALAQLALEVENLRKELRTMGARQS